MELFSNNTKGAVISDCGKYRYQLWRIWDESLPKVLFIMLNPSTADANRDDPTIKRCISFAKSWGYGGLYVGNLFAYRATDPKELLKQDNPVGKLNGVHLMEMELKVDKVIFAWGNSSIMKRIHAKPFKPVLAKTPHYLSLCKDGTPGHPLFLKGDLVPKVLQTNHKGDL